MNIRISIAAIVMATAGVAAICAHSAETQPNQVKGYMKIKLTQAQKVLEGLALEDFDMIAKNAQAMNLLSRDTNWTVLQTSEYARQSEEFQRTTDAIREAAKKKNLDGAALGYVELTMKCIQCHKYVRDARK
jgi:hypothetical protein